MIHHKIPHDFRVKVRKYLDYQIEQKKMFKLEEEEVFSMLNENLILELIISLNGRMLHHTPIFKEFDMQFLSELTFTLQRETYSNNEFIFEEGDEGSKVYFIIKGSVYAIL